MLNYIIRRLLILPVILVGVTMLVFAMLSLLTPYERASLYVSDIPKRQGAIEGIIEKYGLDEPIPVQYWHWMVGRTDEDTGEVKGGVLRGDMGFSKVGKMSVADVIKHRLHTSKSIVIHYFQRTIIIELITFGRDPVIGHIGITWKQGLHRAINFQN